MTADKHSTASFESLKETSIQPYTRSVEIRILDDLPGEKKKGQSTDIILIQMSAFGNVKNFHVLTC